MIYIIIGINIRKINNQAREFSFLLFVCFVTSELQEIFFWMLGVIRQLHRRAWKIKFFFVDVLENFIFN